MNKVRKMFSYVLERMPENELAHLWLQTPLGPSLVAQILENLLACVGDARDVGSTPGLWTCPGEGNGNPLRYSCLGNLMTEEPGELQSKESQRVWHNWARMHTQGLLWSQKQSRNTASKVKIHWGRECPSLTTRWHCRPNTAWLLVYQVYSVSVPYQTW